MRPTLLLVSLLAVLSVSLIFPAHNPRIPINQFVHSLYPRPPPLLNPLEGLTLRLLIPSLCLMAPLIITRDAASKHSHFASLSGSGSASVTPDGCVCFSNSKGALTQDKTPVGGFTVETCMAVCNDNQYIWGGVGNNRCCACFACLFIKNSALC